MHSKRLRASLALALAAFTAACGDSGSTGPSFPDSVSTADAEDFADGVAEYANGVAYSINFNGPSVGVAAPAAFARLEADLPASAATMRGRTGRGPDLSLLDWRNVAARAKGPQLSADRCTFTIRGAYDPFAEEPVDDNENGIPDDLYVKMECVYEYPEGDYLYVEYETQEVTWKEITSSLYGQTIAASYEEGARDNEGYHGFLRYSLEARQDIRTDGITDEASFKLRYEEKEPELALEFFEQGESWDNAFDPTGTINPESNIPDGALTLNGRRYTINSEGAGASFTISTPTPLSYNAACAAVPTNPPFTAGVLLGRLNNSSSQASFEVTFTSCGNYAIDVDGAYDEPVVVTAGR
jgi:hypothetical protein